MAKWKDYGIETHSQYLEGGYHEVEIAAIGEGKSKVKQTPFISVLFRCVETGGTFKREYYISPAAMGFVQDLYEACGVEDAPDMDEMHLSEAHEELIKGKRLLIGINRVNEDDYWQLVAVLPTGSQPAQLPVPRKPAGSRAAAAARRGGAVPEQPLPPATGVTKSAADDDIPF